MYKRNAPLQIRNTDLEDEFAAINSHVNELEQYHRRQTFGNTFGEVETVTDKLYNFVPFVP